MDIKKDILKDKSVAQLCAMVEDKKAFNLIVSEKFNRTAKSVAHHWTSGYYAVPKQFVEDFKCVAVDFIINQNTVTNEN